MAKAFGAAGVAAAVTAGMLPVPEEDSSTGTARVEIRLVLLQAAVSSVALGTSTPPAESSAPRLPATAADSPTVPLSKAAVTASEPTADTGPFQALLSAAIVLASLVVTPFWYLASPVTLPLSVFMGFLSSRLGNVLGMPAEPLHAAFNFYALPLQGIFTGIQAFISAFLPSQPAAIQPASSIFDNTAVDRATLGATTGDAVKEEATQQPSGNPQIDRLDGGDLHAGASAETNSFPKSVPSAFSRSAAEPVQSVSVTADEAVSVADVGTEVGGRTSSSDVRTVPEKKDAKRSRR